MTKKVGAFSFVLHSHLPYVRRAGRWPHGEEMLLEAMAETYIPLLDALYELVEEGYKPRLTLGLTPILLEQLRSPDVWDHFETYVEERLALIESDIARFSRPLLTEWQAAHDRAQAAYDNAVQALMAKRLQVAKKEAGSDVTDAMAVKNRSARTEASTKTGKKGKQETPADTTEAFIASLSEAEKALLPPPPLPVDLEAAKIAQKERDHLLYLAKWYRDWYRGVLDRFRDIYHRDLVAAFADLRRQGVLDVLTSMATHAYTPLVNRDSTIYGQLKTGYESTLRHIGHEATGIWLPECGYRPPFMTSANGVEYYKPGVEEFLQQVGIRYFFTDSFVITGGNLVGKAAGDAIGPYGAIPKRKLVPYSADERRHRKGTTFRPYYVRDSNVAIFGRDEGTGMQVWSASHGYPGDFLYREFHRKDANSGVQYWRISGAQVDLGAKSLYDPYVAFQQVQTHADHFVNLVRQRLQDYHDSSNGDYGIIVSAYDTELYGHWWFEGITWLKEVLRRLSRDDLVEISTVADYLVAHPPTEAMDVPESSWGNGGGHWTWLNPETEWMWPLIHNAEKKMEGAVKRYPQAEGELLAFLRQLARELVLLESSDWPFLITTGQAKSYAEARFKGHLARFERLYQAVNRGMFNNDDRHFLAEVQEVDNPFPEIDYRDFVCREQVGCE